MRNRTVLGGLLWQVYDFASAQNCSHLISGIAEREAMYRKLGFQSLGPAAPEGHATFVPMMMPLGDQGPLRSRRVTLYRRRWEPSSRLKCTLSLLPGPVAVHPLVAQHYSRQPISHRSNAFTDIFEEVLGTLRLLAPSLDAALFAGSGTLANDAVAANLKLLFQDKQGLIVSNGEFGERLTRQAVAAGLNFRHLRFPWGQVWSMLELEREIAAKRAAAPKITTFVLPGSDFPDRCLDAGFEIAYQSPYLRARQWRQIATMGEVSISSLAPLFEALRGVCDKRNAALSEMKRSYHRLRRTPPIE